MTSTARTRRKRPSIVSPCVADHYASDGERIAEFSFPDGAGGLLSLRTSSNGRNVIEIYRAEGVKVIGPGHSYTRAQIVNGTGFSKNARFRQVEDAQ